MEGISPRSEWPHLTTLYASVSCAVNIILWIPSSALRERVFPLNAAFVTVLQGLNIMHDVKKDGGLLRAALSVASVAALILFKNRWISSLLLVAQQLTYVRHKSRPVVEGTPSVSKGDNNPCSSTDKFDKRAWVATTHIFDPMPSEKMPDFTPLSLQQVTELLALEPKLKTIEAARGRMKAHESISTIHQDGIPVLKSNPAMNEALINSMRFVLFMINQEKSEEKKRELLLELAGCLEDCAPVTQSKVAMMHMKLASIGGFDKQISCFISAYKDRIVDETIYEIYPEMKNPTYANNVGSYNQFPHVRSGFVAELGYQLGLNTAGAESDRHRNARLGENINKFEELFREKISIDEIIKEFIIDPTFRRFPYKSEIF